MIDDQSSAEILPKRNSPDFEKRFQPKVNNPRVSRRRTDSTDEKIVEALNAPQLKPKKTPLDKLTTAFAWFVGSWWGVLVHVVWFAIWLVFNFSIDNLTLIVSLEAIFIGIFLLMYTNKAEVERDLIQAQKQAKALSETIADVSLDRKQLVVLDEIKKSLEELKSEVETLKNK